ncbi:MAG: ABC transporter ATP-binding protein [Xanthobacteraceae bacterium]|nr:MAG: ABC transporter ATP-binding protein [Xanthobacteraceae bacterium]
MAGLPASPSHSDEQRYETTTLVRRLVAEQGVLYWRRYALAFLLMGTAATMTALSTYVLGDVINASYVQKDFQKILWLSLAIIVMFIVKGASTYGQQVILSRIGNAIIAANQRAVVAKLMRESIGFFANRHSSEFLSRMSAGAASVSQILNLLITSVGRDLLSLLGLVAVMIYQDPMMSLFGALVAPPAVLMLRKLIRRIRSIATTQFHNSTRIIETLQESLQGIRTVKAFSLETIMQARIDGNIAAVEQSSNKMARVSHRSSPMMESLGGIAIGMTLIYGGWRVLDTGATPGQFFSFIAAFLLAYEPAKRLARLNLELNGAVVGARMLFEIIDSPASEPDDSGKPALQLKDARVELRDVEFCYRPGETVIDRMSFTAQPGLVTALVGPSGGGKSTILALLLRLYDIQRGAILIDGQDIAAVSRASLRRQTAYVGQDVYLFRGTIRENIAFGKSDASDDEIFAAARAACAHDFIMAFPKGYDTPVGEHGAQLSGGQRQRVAIARALIKNAPIILLDEATASLDSESERHVQEAIDHLCHGRTTIVVAHRLHTIMHADAIHVVEGGRIVESGRHDDLLRLNGRYASFFRQQHRGDTLLSPLSEPA